MILSIKLKSTNVEIMSVISFGKKSLITERVTFGRMQRVVTPKSNALQ